MTTREVTQEDIDRVHREECKWWGHSYREIEEYRYDGPVKVICAHCGKSWDVQRDSRP